MEFVKFSDAEIMDCLKKRHRNMLRLYNQLDNPNLIDCEIENIKAELEFCKTIYNEYLIEAKKRNLVK